MSRTEPEVAHVSSNDPEGMALAVEALQRFNTRQDYRSVAADYTIDILDDLVEVTASATISLPASANAQRKLYWVVNTSGGNINVQLNASTADTAANWTSPIPLGNNAPAAFLHTNDGTAQSATWIRVV